MGFKGERLGDFVLDARIGPCREGQQWRVHAPSGQLGTAVLYYEPAWVALVREHGLPEGIPESPLLGRVLARDLAANRPFAVWSHREEHRLARVLGRKAYVPLPLAFPILVQVARGLEALHREGLAHLDLRPSTIALDAEGRVELCFAETQGLRQALLQRLKDKAFEPAELEERKRYLPPEQKGGRVEDAHAADIYAFGVLVHEMVLGQPPDPMETRFPSQRDKRIPKIVDELTASTLERRVRARLPNAVGLPRMLVEGLLRAGFEVDVTDPQPLRWVKRTPWRKGAATADEQREWTSLLAFEAATPAAG